MLTDTHPCPLPATAPALLSCHEKLPDGHLDQIISPGELSRQWRIDSGEGLPYTSQQRHSGGKGGNRLDGNFDVKKIGDVAVVLLSEEMVNAGNVNDLKDKMEPVLEENAKVLCDMSHVRFIDSMGCSLFVSLLKRLQQKGGSLAICCATPPVANLFKLMSFDRLFGLFKTREEAVASFR